MQKENNLTIKSIYQWLRSEKGKRYTFIIFYLLFFIIIFTFFIFPTKDEKLEEEDNSFPFKFNSLENTNYNFTYLVQKDNQKTLYEGRKEGNELSLTSDDDTYIYSYKDGKLSSNNNKEIEALEYLDIYDFKRILKNGKMISEVRFPANGQFAYNYNITNESLGEILGTDTKNTEVNEIIVETSSSKEVLNVTIDILDYMNSLKKSNEELYETYKITITYGDVYE